MGCVTVLEIVFVGQSEVFVCLDFVKKKKKKKITPPPTYEAHRSANEVSVLKKKKKCRFFRYGTDPLKDYKPKGP